MATSGIEKDSQWQKTPVANLVRNAASGGYYGRARIRGRLIWKFLKTSHVRGQAPPGRFSERGKPPRRRHSGDHSREDDLRGRAGHLSAAVERCTTPQAERREELKDGQLDWRLNYQQGFNILL